MKFLRRPTVRSVYMILTAAAAALTMQASQSAPPPRIGLPPTKVSAEPAHNPKVAPAISATALQEFYSESGNVYLSVDGVGTNAASGSVDVDKRTTGSVVEKAFLIAASTGFSNHTISDSDLALDGSPVDIDEATLIASSIGSYNVRADVTALVKPIVDAAEPGRVTFTVAETDTYAMDGEILAVVFRDPAEPSSSISLLFGSQSTAGDSFALRLSDPIDSANPNQKLGLSLGISFGYEGPGNGAQFSTVAVNGQLLTSAAGGQDDGAAENGALLTVGGLDDDPSNPADPNGGAGCDTAPRCDDELYDLKAVLPDGTTTVQVDTANPSNDDNIFFAAFTAQSLAAVVNEGIVLSPSTQTVPEHGTGTLIATVQDDQGNGVPGVLVSVSTSGKPRHGLRRQYRRFRNLEIDVSCLSYGTATVQASFVDPQGVTKTSNPATITCQYDPVYERPSHCRPPGQSLRLGQSAPLTVTVKDKTSGNPVAGVDMTYGTIGGSGRELRAGKH